MFVHSCKLSNGHSLKKELFHFFKVHPLAVSKAFLAVSFIAVNTEVGILISSNHIFASKALASSVFLNLLDHTLLVLISTVSMLVYTLLLWAESKTFLLSSMEDKFVNEFVQHIVVVSCQFFNVEFLDALMVCEFCSRIFFVANLAHNWNCRAISLDMIIELSSSHMLILL